MLHSIGQSLSTVLICRLVLDLRKEGERGLRRRTALGPQTTSSDGVVLSTCAIASFFNVGLDSEPNSNDATRGTRSVASIDRDMERDLQSEGIQTVAMTVFKNRSDAMAT
jgi:hypothetical protein